jgi:hypothetical protein
MSLLRICLSLLIAITLAPPLHAQSFPDYTSTTVNDFADLLPEAEERALSQRLTNLERETGVELTVVTLPTQAAYAPEMTLEAFATALFNHWGVGKAETNDGVMILVFRDDRAMRLELGAAYGRDWDRVAQDVVERHFLNAFGAGDYVRGLTWGTEQTIERIVMPFPRGGGRACPVGHGQLAHHGWLRPGFPAGRRSQLDRRQAGAPAQVPAMRQAGAEPDAGDPDARHARGCRGGRTPAPLRLLRLRRADILPHPAAAILFRWLFRRRSVRRRRCVGPLVALRRPRPPKRGACLPTRRARHPRTPRKAGGSPGPVPRGTRDATAPTA